MIPSEPFVRLPKNAPSTATPAGYVDLRYDSESDSFVKQDSDGSEPIGSGGEVTAEAVAAVLPEALAEDPAANRAAMETLGVAPQTSGEFKVNAVHAYQEINFGTPSSGNTVNVNGRTMRYAPSPSLPDDFSDIDELLALILEDEDVNAEIIDASHIGIWAKVPGVSGNDIVVSSSTFVCNYQNPNDPAANNPGTLTNGRDASTATDATLVGGTSIERTVTLVSGNDTITTDTNGIYVGMLVSGNGIAHSTAVSVVTETTVSLENSATISGESVLTFYSPPQFTRENSETGANWVDLMTAVDLTRHFTSKNAAGRRPDSEVILPDKRFATRSTAPYSLAQASILAMGDGETPYGKSLGPFVEYRRTVLPTEFVGSGFEELAAYAFPLPPEYIKDGAKVNLRGEIVLELGTDTPEMWYGIRLESETIDGTNGIFTPMLRSLSTKQHIFLDIDLEFVSGTSPDYLNLSISQDRSWRFNATPTLALGSLLASNGTPASGFHRIVGDDRNVILYFGRLVDSGPYTDSDVIFARLLWDMI